MRYACRSHDPVDLPTLTHAPVGLEGLTTGQCIVLADDLVWTSQDSITSLVSVSACVSSGSSPHTDLIEGQMKRSGHYTLFASREDAPSVADDVPTHPMSGSGLIA